MKFYYPPKFKPRKKKKTKLVPIEAKHILLFLLFDRGYAISLKSNSKSECPFLQNKIILALNTKKKNIFKHIL